MQTSRPNQDDASSVKAWNDAMIEKYNPERYHHHSSPIVRFIEGRRVKKILSELTTDSDAETLEVGCGAGDILLQVPKGRLHGFDLSEKMVETTRKKILKHFPDRLGTVVIGDAQAWPASITSMRYTNIYCSEVIEHIPEPRKLIAELHRTAGTWTKSIVVSTPNEQFINRLKGILIALKVFKFFFPTLSTDMTEEWHLSSFDIPLMQKTCEGYFDITKIQGAPFRWFPIRYIFTLKKIDHE